MPEPADVVYDLCTSCASGMRLIQSMPAPYFYRCCPICGDELRTPWGPEVHEESRHKYLSHIDHHSDAELIAFAKREAIRRGLWCGSFASGTFSVGEGNR